MALTKQDVKQSLSVGSVVIEPYDDQCLNNASYDVTLGKYYCRQKDKLQLMMVPDADLPLNVTSDGVNLSDLWEVDKMDPKQGVVLEPGDFILAHTEEFIGSNRYVPEMKAKSTMARSGISICRCAGWGDVGYINRWTMEVVNHTNRAIRLKPGLRIGQIVFWDTSSRVPDKELYGNSGKYQKGQDIETIKRSWRPEQMFCKS